MDLNFRKILVPVIETIQLPRMDGFFFNVDIAGSVSGQRNRTPAKSFGKTSEQFFEAMKMET